ncbi:MAG: hypothetical protein AMXMBFR77_23800 [Phycisphaerales bacterium]|nr:MAG: hypothetical protein BroJett004_00270 [Planctomycetota bacterium]
MLDDSLRQRGRSCGLHGVGAGEHSLLHDDNRRRHRDPKHHYHDHHLDQREASPKDAAAVL